MNIGGGKFLWAILLIFLLQNTTLAQGGQVIDEIVVKVDNYIILRSELEQAVQQFAIETELKENEMGEAVCFVLENLVINKVMLAKAEIDSVIIEEETIENQLNRRMDAIVAQAGGEQNLVEYYGKTIDMLKDDLREPIREQLTIQRMQEEITQDVKVTPKEVQEFYRKNLKDTVIIVPEEAEVAHLIRIPTVNISAKNKTKQRLEEIRQRILNGEDFAELAKEFSEDKASGRQGGDLGWQSRGMLVPEFEAEVYRLKPDEISGIIESQFGFHLIKLTERRGNEFRASHILLRPPTGEIDLKATEQFLDSIRTLVLNDSLTFEKATKEFSEDENTADNGGYIRGYEGTRIPLNELESPIYLAIQTMKVGDISKPLPYRTDDGREAMRIIYYKAKYPAHPLSLEKDYEKVYQMTLNQKRNQVIFEWFQEAKKEVFISIDEKLRGCPILEAQ